MEEVIHEMTLNEKQKKFVDYYCETGNAEQSAIRAGYSKNTARGHSHKMLHNVAIKSAIEKRNKELEDERIADVTEIKQFWTSMFRDPLTDPKDQLKASELLAKTAGAFIEKVEHSGEMTQNINNMTNLTEDELRKIAEMSGD